VKEETVIVVMETRFREFSEDCIVELLEPGSVLLMNEEPAKLDRRTYKRTQDYHGNGEVATAEENTLTIKKFKEIFSEINETVDYFGAMMLSVFILPRLNSNWKMYCHA
jgi:hypothetical protein